MSGSGTELVYWDTCIFYALFKGESTHGAGIIDAIKHEYLEFLQGNLRIVTSTVTVAEVARGSFEKAEDFQKFKDIRFADGFEFSDPRVKIMELASELKDYFYNNPLGENGEYKNLNLGDAIHLATAIVLGVTRFVTLDGKHKGKIGEIGLLKLTNPIAGKYALNITKPVFPAQPALDGF